MDGTGCGLRQNGEIQDLFLGHRGVVIPWFPRRNGLKEKAGVTSGLHQEVMRFICHKRTKKALCAFEFSYISLPYFFCKEQ